MGEKNFSAVLRMWIRSKYLENPNPDPDAKKNHNPQSTIRIQIHNIELSAFFKIQNVLCIGEAAKKIKLFSKWSGH